MIAAGFQAIYCHQGSGEAPTQPLPPENRAKPPPKVNQFSGKEVCSPDSFIFRVPQQRVVLCAQGWACSNAPHLPPTSPFAKGNTESSFSCLVQAEVRGIILDLGLFAQSDMFLAGFAVCWAQSCSCLSPRQEVGWGRGALCQQEK